VSVLVPEHLELNKDVTLVLRRNSWGWTLVNLGWTPARATLPVQLLPNAVRSPLGLSVNVAELPSAMRRRSRIHVTALNSHLFRDDVRR
jgi:hypothetical protein